MHSTKLTLDLIALLLSSLLLFLLPLFIHLSPYFLRVHARSLSVHLIRLDWSLKLASVSLFNYYVVDLIRLVDCTALINKWVGLILFLYALLVLLTLRYSSILLVFLFLSPFPSTTPPPSPQPLFLSPPPPPYGASSKSPTNHWRNWCDECNRIVSLDVRMIWLFRLIFFFTGGVIAWICFVYF